MIFTMFLPSGSKQIVAGSPSHIPEKLRVTLVEFRALYEAAKVQLGTTKSQLSNVRQNLKQLSAECSTYREIVTLRTSAMAVSMCVCMCMCLYMCVYMYMYAHIMHVCQSMRVHTCYIFLLMTFTNFCLLFPGS